MKGITNKALLQRSFSTDLIKKIDHNRHTVTVLKAMSKNNLEQFYSKEESEIIRNKIGRAPIDKDVLENVLKKADSSCAYCYDGNALRPYQVHHIEFYSIAQDNSEENLFLLCPTHHAVVHANKICPSEQKDKRREWYAVAQIATDYKNKGLSFPYGAFNAVDYSDTYEASQIVSLSL